MNIYLLLITFTSFLATIFGFLFFRKNPNKKGFFALLFIVFSAIWMIFYYIFFSSIDNPILLTYLCRVGYWSGVPCVFSFLLFVKNFHRNETKIFTTSTILILLGYLVSMYVYCYTDLIIEGIVYETVGQVYREVTGVWYPITYFVYSFFLLSVIYIARKRLIDLASLEKKRLTNIVFSTFCLVAILVFLQLILPLFGIWIFERQIIIIYLVYIVYIYQTLKRYYFSSLFYGFGKILSMVLGLIGAIFLINILKTILLEIQSGNLHNYWNIADTYGITETIIVITFFSLCYRFFLKIFLGDSGIGVLKDNIQKLQKRISHITDIDTLNIIIRKEVGSLFKTKIAYISFFDEKLPGKNAFQIFFQENYRNNIFINDLVFIDENKGNFNIEDLMKEITPDIFLMLPIYNSKNVCTAMLVLGSKSFGDFYTKAEINALKEFTFFIGIHLKYIQTYSEMVDLSENLDLKVDQKTIEYNDLINQQKEFISMISHEIRSPIGGAIFQVDSLIDDIDHTQMSLSNIRRSIRSIGDQLANIGELLKKLFSVQYFDTRTVVLLKEKVQLSVLLEKEFEIYSRMHEDITFIDKISTNLGFVNIDKIHFQQVITNLLENAIKFANPKNPIIMIECVKKYGNTLFLNIEDNGSGYGDIDPATIFQKYTVGSHAKLGLGMGLYLCERIVSMHGGKISANRGKILSGASFLIELPV